MGSSGYLRIDERGQLLKWANPGRRELQLLYSFTKDGASASTFHTKCNYKGPTVTVIYNTEGSVYGGYTTHDWDSSGTYKVDELAFMFSLRHSDKKAFVKFPIKNATQAIYCNANYGPTFGGGHDLYTFNNNLAAQGTSYTLNGNVNFGHSYDRLNKTVTDITNSIMTVTELEVYGVTEIPDVQWRKVSELNRQIYIPFLMAVINNFEDRFPDLPTLQKCNVFNKLAIPDGDMTCPVKMTHLNLLSTSVCLWKRQSISGRRCTGHCKFLDGLKEELEQFAPPEEFGVSRSNILLVGQVGAGKSSFFNNVDSVFKDHITQRACSGRAENSVTLKYCAYQIRRGIAGRLLNFRLCDTLGLEVSQGISPQDMLYLLDGHVQDGYVFNPTMPITTEAAKGFKEKPSLDDMIHCVCFVVDGSTVMEDKVLEKMKALHSVIRQKGIPHVVLLTKVDRVVPGTDEDLSSVFRSATVEGLVDTVANILGVQRNHVFPTKNYENEVDLSDEVSALTLFNLRQMLRASVDYMSDKYRNESCDSVDSKKD